MTEQASGLALLRQPFPANQISKLPKESKAQADERKANRACAINCTVCGGWHHKNAVHLDYVGHAALTDRLLDADLTWTWEPLAMGDGGLPVMDEMGGMWIKLTVCGVTRLGYGHAGTKTGGDAIKEVIGDALRNAAMRFGAALELWHKGDLHAEPEPEKAPAPDAMPAEVIADWCAYITEAATSDDVKARAEEAMSAATEAKDRSAYQAFRTAAKNTLDKMKEAA